MTDNAGSKKTFWDGFAPKYDRFMRRLEKDYARMMPFILENLTPQMKALECAAGTGLVTVQVAPRVSQLVASDLSAEMLTIASAKAAELSLPNISFEQCGMDKLPFDDASFDAVLAVNVLHLLDNPQAAVAEMARVLKPGGSMICATYCHGESLRTRFLSRIMSLSGFRSPNRWSTRSYRELFTARGLRVTREEIIKGIMPLSVVVAGK